MINVQHAFLRKTGKLLVHNLAPAFLHQQALIAKNTQKRGTGLDIETRPQNARSSVHASGWFHSAYISFLNRAQTSKQAGKQASKQTDGQINGLDD